MGGTDFCDRFAIKDDNSSNAQVTERDASSRMRTESTVLRIMNSLSSCDSVSYRKICKGSYKSGDLWDTETLITGVDVIRSMASSTYKSTEFFTRGSSIFDSRAHQQLLTLALA